MRQRFLRGALATFAAGLALTAAACGSSTPTSAPTGGSSSTGVTGTITVFAASSLTETFGTIKTDFEKANPGSNIVYNFAGSSTLATQITTGGAKADVFAAASPATMKTVTDAGDADGTPVNFVKNQLVIAVPKGNPKGIHGLADLTRPGIKVAECAASVPCGAAAKMAIAASGLTITPVTLESDVKQALSKVKLGEVDAALVYRTDAIAASSDVDGIEFPESAQALNLYPIVTLKDAPNKAGAQAFVAYVESDKGKAVFAAAGFQSP